MGKMKKKTKMLCIGLLGILFVLGFCMHYTTVRPCALCNSKPYHGLCLVDRQAGKVYEFTIYDNAPFQPGELSELQTVGTFSYLEMGEVIGYRNTVENSAGVSLPDESWLGWNRGFCFGCKKLLGEHADRRYLIADLYNPKAPALFSIADGVVYESRCYEVTVMKDPEKEELDILVTGHFDLTGYATSHTGLPNI